MKDYYAILGVGRTASDIGIKKKFRKRALQIHPDKSGKDTSEGFVELYEAYSILSDQKKKIKYDTLYDTFNQNIADTADESFEANLIAISEKGKIYSKNFDRFEREVLLKLLLFSFVGNKLGIATFACLFFGIWTVGKGLFQFEFDYVLVGLCLTLFGLVLWMINANHFKRDFED